MTIATASVMTFVALLAFYACACELCMTIYGHDAFIKAGPLPYDLFRAWRLRRLTRMPSVIDERCEKTINSNL